MSQNEATDTPETSDPDAMPTEMASIDEVRDQPDLGPTGEDAIEPDETPDRFLIMVGIGLTVTVVAAFTIATVLFNSTLDAERTAKGYTDAPTASSTAH